MKRVSLTVVIILLAVCFSIAGAIAINELGLNGEQNTPIQSRWKVRVADNNMYPDNYEYIDYAEEVKFDEEKYPLLANQGLFWVKWDETLGEYIKIDADTAEGAALVDPSKPTIINIHGMLVSGYYDEEMYWLPEHCISSEELGYEIPVQMFKFWFDKGYNVGMYSYQKFAAESIGYHFIEEKMWSTEGKVGIRFATPENKFVEDVSPYCLSEHFAADYIRAMRLLPESFGEQEIRFAAHSMGGELVTGGTFLLTELAEDGQIDPNKLPDRIAMEDTFFGTNILMKDGYVHLGQTNLPLRWSGKTMPGGTSTQTIIECIKDISANDIVIEYYSYPDSFLRMALTPSCLKTLIDNSVYIVLSPDFTTTVGRHNGIREYYLTSILWDYDDTQELTDTEKVAYAASIPTAELKTLVGRCFTVQEGSKTLLPQDDVYIEDTEYYYPSND